MARTPGAKNKLGAQARENIIAVFTRLGGTATMAKWAQKNRTEFYRIYARLLPTEVTADVTTHYVIEAPSPAATAEEWLKQHAPTTQ